MSELENLLYRAFEKGIKDEVMDEVTRLKSLKENKYAEVYDLYSKAYSNVRKRK